jgi:hypothetical protein
MIHKNQRKLSISNLRQVKIESSIMQMINKLDDATIDKHTRY